MVHFRPRPGESLPYFQRGVMLFPQPLSFLLQKGFRFFSPSLTSLGISLSYDIDTGLYPDQLRLTVFRMLNLRYYGFHLYSGRSFWQLILTGDFQNPFFDLLVMGVVKSYIVRVRFSPMYQRLRSLRWFSYLNPSYLSLALTWFP